MTKKIYLETWKSVLGCSISHYWKDQEIILNHTKYAKTFRMRQNMDFSDFSKMKNSEGEPINQPF